MKIFELLKPIEDEDNLDVWTNGFGGFKNYEQEKLEHVFEFISKHCSQAVKDMQSKNKFLYRGINAPSPTIFLGATPVTREPYGMGKDQQWILDKIFKLTGFISLRRNSICATTKPDEYVNFGKIYYIFPVNGFNFTWSKIIKDVGGNNEIYNELKKLYNSYIGINRLDQDAANKFIKKWDFRNNNFDQALWVGNEITINGQYVAIKSSDYPYIYAVKEYFGITG
jgi:hypothetical protein